MKTTTTFLIAAILLLPAAASAGEPAADLVETAVSAGQFGTLTAALSKAGLVALLSGKGPFTVFAPTDEAFAKLPEGTVEDLLRPENRGKLREILAFHVVEGRVRSADLLPTPQAKTLAGAPVPFGLRVGEATVVRADIECANGVIHAIDRVLLPPAKPAVDPVHVIRRAVEVGAPLYNAGDEAGCARTYAAAARVLLSLPIDRIGDLRAIEMRSALATTGDDADARAWALRRVFDDIVRDVSFEPLMEASLPRGFPGAGPVGRVVLKEYPRYRAARSDGGDSFWTLFRHIKKNEVAMTAPVEMTMDDRMRPRDMAFLYGNPDQGAAGRQGDVEVLDLEPAAVLSIGMRGPRDADAVALAKLAIEEKLEREGLTRAGEWRLMGYNSPMVPGPRKFWELQLPVGTPD